MLLLSDHSIPASRIPFLSAVAGSMATRTASRIAYKQNGRSLVTQDLLPILGNAFTETFEDSRTEGKL